MSKNPFLACLIRLIFAIGILVPATAMSQIPEYSIRKFGQTAENPFHSANGIQQDEYGRLQFFSGRNEFVFDGVNFESNAPHAEENIENTLLKEENSIWYKLQDKEIINVRKDSTYRFNLRRHVDIGGIVQVYRQGAHYYLLANYVLIKYSFQEGSFQLASVVDLPGVDAIRMHKMGDTIVFRSLNQPMYLLESAPKKIVKFGPTRMSDFYNGTIYLPNARMLIHTSYGDSIIEQSSNLYQALISFGDYNYSKLLLDSKNNLWVGSRNFGLKKIPFQSNNWEQVALKLDSKVFFTSIYEDFDGHIWVGTQGAGLYQIYAPLFGLMNKENGFSSDNIWNITQDKKGSIYVAYNCNGIDVIHPEGQMRRQFFDDCIWGVVEDSAAHLWVLGKGVKQFLPNGQKRHYTKNDGLHSNSPSSILVCKNGDLWVGTRQAIHKFQGNRFIKFQIPDVEQFDRVFNIVELDSGSLLLVTNSGKLFHFIHEEFKLIDFPSSAITKLHRENDQRIWISTEDKGLFLFTQSDTITNRFDITSWNEKNTKLPKLIYQIHHDLENNLWGIDGQNQVFRVSIDQILDEESKAEVDFYTTGNGLPLIDLNVKAQPTSLLLKNGKMIFPNIYGAIVIDSKKFQSSSKPFPILVSMLQDSSVSTTEVNLQLDYGINDLKFSARSVFMDPNSSVVYRYKVNDNSWQTSNQLKDIVIYDLPKGESKVRIGGGYRNGDWLGQEALIVVYTLPLFYQTFWFWLLTSIILGLGISFFVRWRTGIIKRQRNVLAQKVAKQTREIEAEKQQLALSLKKQTELAEKLNLTQAAKNRMYAQISHEFKSPLQSVRGLLVNNQQVFSEKDQNRAIRNIEKLIAISGEIMDLSKAISGKLKVKKDWYNINNVIQYQIDLIQPLAEIKKIDIYFEQKERIEYLKVDLALMQKTISNLLSNAVKFSKIGGQIIVSSKGLNNNQRISFEDQGAGIPASEIGQLTEAYFQASNNKEQGTGIGLSLVKEILQLHQSQLSISSKLGKGSTFSFLINRPDETEAKELKEILSNRNADIELDQTLINPKLPLILTVDDSQDILYFLGNALKKDYSVIKASNGKNGLKLMNRISPDLIISDVNMPVMNGISFLEKVRAIPAFVATPVIFLTGSSSEKIELLGLKSGVDVVLQKPINKELLIAQVAQLLKRQDEIVVSLRSSFAHDLLPPNIQNDDLALMRLLEEIMLREIDHVGLKSHEIANEMGLGEKTLRNRVKSISGTTLKEYLRNFRLEKAKILIEEGYGTLGEIATATGHSSLSYFSKRYKIYFGQNPSTIERISMRNWNDTNYI